MPNTNELMAKLNFTCTFDDQSKSTNWILNYNGSKLQEVPECLYHCSESPVPSNKIENLEAIWDGSPWSDTVPIFSCTNSKLQEFTIFEMIFDTRGTLDLCFIFVFFCYKIYQLFYQ